MVSAEAMEPWRTDLLKHTAELAQSDKRALQLASATTSLLKSRMFQGP